MIGALEFLRIEEEPVHPRARVGSEHVHPYSLLAYAANTRVSFAEQVGDGIAVVAGCITHPKARGVGEDFKALKQNQRPFGR
ncbi:hypothetical protein AX279_04805 [Pseudomonas sp. J237]|nr:hypothetical protein AX279_04805 [Pseudomonas sp. J237]